MRVENVPVSSPAPGLRVVVADDDPSIRALLTDLLRLEGYRVRVAADGEELLFHVVRAFAEGAGGAAGIDLIVSDVWMPFCSGLDVLIRLREARRATPVLLLSSDPDPLLRDRIEALGGQFLEKPFTYDGLRHAIRSGRSASGYSPLPGSTPKRSSFR